MESMRPGRSLASVGVAEEMNGHTSFDRQVTWLYRFQFRKENRRRFMTEGCYESQRVHEADSPTAF